MINARIISSYARWTARIISALIMLLFLVFLIGEGAPKHLTTREMEMFGALGIMILGLILAFKWELPGCGITIIGYAAFSLLNGNTMANTPFIAFPIAAILHLIARILNGKRRAM
jgi:hypothetical protein